ncbi:EF-hand calcium-binding domain-containing protein 5 isoform X2 [Apus apus]|nr:EF-hand calcium-binding domain-containing protein 5 isoform X2 [Apus apus]XP_051491425.1 EF-hand calcium-binding domain-containing protein 5 isoform X2 [Apus apus]
MAAQPEAAAQPGRLKEASLEGKSSHDTEIKRDHENDKLPCLSDGALWKDCFYAKVQQRCLSLQETKVKMILAQKAKEEKVKKREPCDLLTREWFSEVKVSLDSRIYLLDKLLPTLIPGMEYLLLEVERKNVLAQDEESTTFNPINFLGEYLKRHNPHYGIATKPTPYLRGMEMVTEELKAQVPGTAPERLARMKTEAKKQRKERERVEKMKSRMKEIRKEELAIQFKKWRVDVSGRIPLAMVQSALKSFPEFIPSTPIEVIEAISDRKLKIVNTLEKKVNIDEFKEYVYCFTENFSNDTFQQMLKHLCQCADDFQRAIKHDMWRQMFADLFLDCDYGKVGVLDRQKTLALLVEFYDKNPVVAKRGFCNPRQWPIIEPQEIELADLWGGLVDLKVCKEPSEKLVVSQTEVSEGVDDVSAVKSTDFEASGLDGGAIQSEESSFQENTETEKQTDSASADRQEEAFLGSTSAGYSPRRDGEPGPEKQVEKEEISLGREPDSETKREDYVSSAGEPGSEGQGSQEDNQTAETTSIISGPTPEATAMTSEDKAMADMDAPVAEVVKTTPTEKESVSGQPGSQLDQQTSSETRPPDEDLLQDQGPACSDRQDSPDEADQEFEVPWSGDFLTYDLNRRYGTKIPEDWKYANTKFPDLHPLMAGIQERWASPTRSAFNESCLNLPRFVHLMETFVGEDISLPTLKRLVAFIKEGYQQTEEEKMEQLQKVDHSSRLAQRKLLLEALFEKWDKNASGLLNLEEVNAVLSTFKEGMEEEALRNAKEHLCSRYPQLSRVEKLTPVAFQTFLELVASEFPGNEDEAIDNMVQFLTRRVKQSQTECLRGLARRRWLHSVQQAAETSRASMEPVYKAVFRAISQDAEAYGDNKKISAYIALLEENQLSPERGQLLLHYVACTTDDAPYVLNQTLYRDMKGVSFTAVEEGKPIYVSRVHLHGNIHFWNRDRPVVNTRGAFLVLPLHDAHWRVFGILGLDTLRDEFKETIFPTHEIRFYQGVSRAFSKAYHHICMLESLLQMTVTALEWLHSQAPNIHSVTAYLVEPGKDQTCGYALHKMITTYNAGQKEIHSSPVLLRKESLLRDYLFKCIDSSEVICTSVYGESHIAVPLRDLSGGALGLYDISTGHQKLPPQERKDLQKMLKMAQAACSEILKMSSEETEPTYVLEAEHTGRLRHAGILFHRFMLQDLRECIQKLGAEHFAEMRSYAEPPALLHNIVKAVLLLFRPDWKGSKQTENWSECILKLDDNLIQEIYCFDPTAASVRVESELLLDCITGVPRAAVWQLRSAPAEYLYHWVHTCLALAEITRSLDSNKAPSLAPFAPTQISSSLI